MSRFITWIVCAILGIATLNGQSNSLNNNKLRLAPDTIRLNRLILEGKRAAAASILSHFLHNKSELNNEKSAGSWLHLAILCAWTDSPDNAREAYNRYITLSAGRPDTPTLKADRLLYQSLILANGKLFNQAADSLIASIAIRPVRDTPNVIRQADSYGALARLYKITGDLFESSRNFDLSINLNRSLTRTEPLADDLTDLSSVLSNMDPTDTKADSVLIEALEIYTRMDSLPAIAQVLNELGVLFNRRGNLRKSLDYFKQSLEIKLRTPGISKQDLVVVNNNIGHCYQFLGDSDSARLFFFKSVEYAKLSDQSPAPYFANLGASFGGEEKYNLAIEYFQRALNSLDPACSLKDPSTNPSTNKVTPQLADFTAYKAHAFHRKYHQSHNTADLINGLNTFMVALQMMDTLRFMYSFESKPFLSSEAKIHFFNALDMALDLYELSGEKRYLDQAFQLSERNKSATLNEFLRTNQAREYMGSVAPWIKQEDSIKQLINTIESNLIRLTSSNQTNSDSTAALQLRLSRLTDEIKNIGVIARKENPAFFQMAYVNNGYLPSDIQQLIQPGEALADFTVVRDARRSADYLIVMVLTADTLFTYRDTLPENFREDIEAFRATITPYVNAIIYNEFSRLAHLMYENLFEPIEKFRGISRLIILPDEELGFLPFEVFVSDTLKSVGLDFRKFSYLNKRYQISYISSHEQFYQIRKNSQKKEPAIVYAFAPFISKGTHLDNITLPPLANSGEEINTTSGYFRTKAFRNKDAGEQSLRQAFEHESVITLSTHSIMDPDRPMQSRLILNPAQPDGSLYLFEMLSLKIKSSLVVLNACNTGSGQLQVGEGIMSLARGFQFAGVQSVVTTLWPIDDRSSATVMKFFFKNLYDGMDQREALMKAKNSYLAQASKAAGAPYFWGAQVLIGDPGRINIQQRSINIILLITILFSVIIITTLWVFRKKVGYWLSPLETKKKKHSFADQISNK